MTIKLTLRSVQILHIPMGGGGGGAPGAPNNGGGGAGTGGGGILVDVIALDDGGGEDGSGGAMRAPILCKLEIFASSGIDEPTCFTISSNRMRLTDSVFNCKWIEIAIKRKTNSCLSSRLRRMIKYDLQSSASNYLSCEATIDKHYSTTRRTYNLRHLGLYIHITCGKQKQDIP